MLANPIADLRELCCRAHPHGTARPTREKGDDKHTGIGRDFRRSLAQAPAPSRINCKISSGLLKTFICQISKASTDGAWRTPLVLAVPMNQISP